jgi:hypothetical protein
MVFTFILRNDGYFTSEKQNFLKLNGDKFYLKLFKREIIS